MKKTLIGTLTLGSIVSLAAASANAGANGFAVTDLGQGYQVAAADKGAEGKCGEAKCGAKDAKKDKKDKEGKCGEAKCGAQDTKDKSAKKDEKSAEGKCGEGACGGSV